VSEGRGSEGRTGIGMGTGTMGSDSQSLWEGRGYVPVFLPVLGQEHWIGGYDRRSRRYRCDRTF
jgi:hypothetical protein